MGRQIIKQPNGKYAIWSSVVDNFIFVDASPQDIIDFYVEDFRLDIEPRVKRQISLLESGEKPYHQFTMDWQQALNTIKSVHGEDGLAELVKELD